MTVKNLIISTLIFVLSQKFLLAETVIADYNVVPLPQTVNLTDEKPFILDSNTQIFYTDGDEQMKRNANFLAQYIKEIMGFELSVVTKKQRLNIISLSLDKNIKGKDSYKINTSVKEIKISGCTPVGVFYGIQTLRKSLPCEENRLKLTSTIDKIVMPSVVVEDSPRFAYRGMMLDCARHFFPVRFVKEYIDLLALHNMNTFHWHLTDDQGWRIEVKAYPRLTETGSRRSKTIIGNNSDIDDGIPHGGYYTQEEIREIVKYAHERYITIIPEFDMPGHTMAVLASYPELGCTGGPYEVGHKWGIYHNVLCAGNEKSYEFVMNVLDEFIQLFPSKYIHIGGDETPTVCWENCPKCKTVKVNGESLQGHFMKTIENYLALKGRRIIGWDEILDCDISKGATIMAWRGINAGVKGAEMGHDVIMTPLTHCYFDYYQTENKNYEPSITGMWSIDVKKVYELEPVPDSLSVEARKHILGVQANLWTEYIPIKEVAEYMVLPRMAALAEVQWTNADKKNFDDFKIRITRLTKIYDKYGWKYALHLWPERMTKDRWYN
jgi:hexosaminidase